MMGPSQSLPDGDWPALASFAALYERERVPMLRLATLLVGSVETAEEMVQDGFAAVDQRWDHLDRPGAYLRTTVVNGCRAVLRKRVLERRYFAETMEPGVMEAPDRLFELRDALDRLSERQRVVIVLRYFVDVGDEEIAATLECRPATVRSLARRALAVLREELS